MYNTSERRALSNWGQVGQVMGTSGDQVGLVLVGARAEQLFSLPLPEWQRRAWAKAGAAGTPRRDSVVAHAGWILSPGLAQALAERRGAALIAEPHPGASPRLVAAHVGPAGDHAAIERMIAAGETSEVRIRAAGLIPQSPEELAGAYNHQLRKREAPYALSLDVHDPAAVEERLFRGSYKGVTDLVTKYVWPRPALTVTRWCARMGLTPNMVTTASLVLVAVAFWCFWNSLWAEGLVIGWLMTFLDTVDGKLARVTMQYSSWGNVYDHGIDLVHPPFWYFAMWYGLDGAWSGSGWADLSLAVILFGYVAVRIFEGVFIHLYGFHIHVWQRIDSIARMVTARRNPNMLILTVAALFGEFDVGFLLVAAWTVIWLMFHFVRLGQAVAAPARPASWLEG